MDKFEQYGFGGQTLEETPDYGQFMASTPAEVDAPAAVEMPAQPVEEKAKFNYMAAMQGMFQAINGGEPKEETPAPVVSMAPVEEKKPSYFAQPVVAEPTVEKNEEYWSYVDSILNHFDDGKVNKGIANPKTYAQDFFPSVAETPMQPEEDQTEAQKAYAARQVRLAEEERKRKEVEQALAYQQEQYRLERLRQQQLAEEAKRAAVEEIPVEETNPYDMVDHFLNTEAPAPAVAAPVEPGEPQEDDILPSKSKKEQRAEQKAQKKVEKKAPKEKKEKKKSSAIFPCKGDSAFEVVRKLVVIISLLVFLGCLAIFGYMFKEQRDNNNLDKIYAQEMTNSAQSAWVDIKAKYPNVQFPEGMQVKFASLYAQNQDLAGWIRIPGLGIDYPVLQNGDFYLRHNFNGDYSAYGAPFLDKENRIQPLNQNTVIYAHSMRRDDQMFTNLKAYKTVDGFKENPIIEFSTLYKDYKFKVYAVMITNGSSKGDNGYLFNYTTPRFASQDAFVSFVENVNQRALYTTGVDMKADDHLITLSTCTYEFNEARLVVIGRLIRPGELAHVDTSKAVKNTNPRYPAAYYKAKGLTNPYQNAEQWKNK